MLKNWILGFQNKLELVKNPFLNEEKFIKGPLERWEISYLKYKELYEKKCLEIKKREEIHYSEEEEIPEDEKDDYDDYCKEGLPEEDQEENEHADSAEEMAELFD